MNWGNPNTLGSPNSLQSSTLKFAQLSLGNLTREKPNIWQVLWVLCATFAMFISALNLPERSERIGFGMFWWFLFASTTAWGSPIAEDGSKTKNKPVLISFAIKTVLVLKKVGRGCMAKFPGGLVNHPFLGNTKIFSQNPWGNHSRAMQLRKKNLHCPYTKNLDTWFIEHTLLPLVGGRWGGWLDHVGSGHVNLSCQVQDKRNLLKFSGRFKLLVC